MSALSFLSGVRVVPVVVIDDVDVAAPLAETLLDAGLNVIEVTLRSEDAIVAIEKIAAALPSMVVGAGSIRLPEQVAEVRDAGARFVVSAGATDELIDAAETAGLPFIPGAVTASEMLRLLARGYVLQKFFPAELAGGAPYLKAVGAPLPEVRFMPTGGISTQLARDYLALPNVACVGGTWIAPTGLLNARDFDSIRGLARAAADL